MKQIDDNLLAIFNCMVKNKNDWEYVTDDQKEKFFFIINRQLSKKYPEKSKLLNDKLINKVSAMDTWYFFMLDKPYQKWFWSKSGVDKQKSEWNESDLKSLLVESDISKEDLQILINYYPDIVNEEIKYLKDAQKPTK